jgi:hypothetical protein
LIHREQRAVEDKQREDSDGEDFLSLAGHALVRFLGFFKVAKREIWCHA